MRKMVKSFVLAILAIFWLIGAGFCHMLWIEKEDGKFKVFWGHKGEVQAYDPGKIEKIKAFDEKGRYLKLKKEVIENFLVLLSDKKPSLILASMEGVYLVTTPEGRKRMDKIEAQKKGLQVVESFYVLQATKAVFADSAVLKKSVGLKLEPVFVKSPYEGKDEIVIKVFYDGKPAEGVTILNPYHKELAKTDANGMAKIKVEDLKMKEGYYALVCFYKVRISDPKADYLWCITSLTWQK
jgi:nickel transport protein